MILSLQTEKSQYMVCIQWWTRENAARSIWQFHQAQIVESTALRIYSLLSYNYYWLSCNNVAITFFYVQKKYPHQTI